MLSTYPQASSGKCKFNLGNGIILYVYPLACRKLSVYIYIYIYIYIHIHRYNVNHATSMVRKCTCYVLGNPQMQLQDHVKLQLAPSVARSWLYPINTRFMLIKQDGFYHFLPFTIVFH